MSENGNVFPIGEVANIPDGTTSRGAARALYDSILALPGGKSLKLPLSELTHKQRHNIRQSLGFYARQDRKSLHMRTIMADVFVWLEDKSQ